MAVTAAGELKSEQLCTGSETSPIPKPAERVDAGCPERVKSVRPRIREGRIVQTAGMDRIKRCLGVAETRQKLPVQQLAVLLNGRLARAAMAAHPAEKAVDKLAARCRTGLPHSSIVYLTSCHGGTTVFPTLGIEVPPDAGRMIAYPSSLPHGVRPVVSGKRHTLASWYTDDPKREER